MIKRIKPNICEGLSKEQVASRISSKLVNYDNVLPTKSYKQIILSNIFTLFNIINLFLGFFIVLTGEYKNLTFLGVAICNTIISMIQEIRAKRTIDKLAIISSTKVKVVRDKKELLIGINDVVLDDIVKYKLGNQVVVDSIVLDGIVYVDESCLTGESEPIFKQKGDRLLSGSFIISGACTCFVDSVGQDCYANKITKEAKYLKKVTSEIMYTLNKIIKFISIVIVPLGIFLFINQYKVLLDFNETIVSVVAALIGTIPEGLVLLTSTVLAISSLRLAHSNVLVQELYCIENLARVDTVCLDKTGTLTTGKMKVVDVVSLSNSIDINKVMSNICNYMDDESSTTLALQAYFGISNEFNLIEKVSFSSMIKNSIYEFDDKTYIVGAPEFIEYIGKIECLSDYQEKYRVLLVGTNNDKIVDNKVSMKFIPIALILIEDEIRECAKETLDYLKSQDVDIKIISGDNIKTIENIASNVGLTNLNILDMSKVNGDSDLNDIVEKYDVFGRVTPEQKKELILALKNRGHKVAMTGDGVNDVLALKESDCSIAMASGSDATRNVSQIVLLDSDFKAIPLIIKEGRRTINNLERSASLFLTKTIYAIILAIMFLFINMDYPFIPIQLTLISVINIGIPSFILALEPNHNRVKGKFIIKIITKSMPAALTIILNIISIFIIGNIFDFSSDYISTMSVILVAFTGFILLFKVCLPFNYLRGILFGTLIGIFICFALGLPTLFELVLLTPFQFVFTVCLCLLDIGVFNLLTIFSEKKIKKHEELIVK